MFKIAADERKGRLLFDVKPFKRFTYVSSIALWGTLTTAIALTE